MDIQLTQLMPKLHPQVTEADNQENRHQSLQNQHQRKNHSFKKL